MKNILLFCMLLPLSLSAHPHTFVDLLVKISHEKDKIISLHVEWKFDEMTSQMLIMEFDQNGDMKIDNQEKKYIQENYFETLKPYGFYTYLQIDNKLSPVEPKNFLCRISKESQIVYAFDIQINADKKDVFIDFYDEDNFTAFILKKQFISSDILFKISKIDKEFYYANRLEFK